MGCLGNLLWFIFGGAISARAGVWQAVCGVSRLWVSPLGCSALNLLLSAAFPLEKKFVMEEGQCLFW